MDDPDFIKHFRTLPFNMQLSNIKNPRPSISNATMFRAILRYLIFHTHTTQLKYLHTQKHKPSTYKPQQINQTNTKTYINPFNPLITSVKHTFYIFLSTHNKSVFNHNQI